ncbi:MAG: hypothetical protein KDB00_28555 [Planctomycetales bacterium]|nr:hypothetical protein [Planctomycetales bacterium]
MDDEINGDSVTPGSDPNEQVSSDPSQVGSDPSQVGSDPSQLSPEPSSPDIGPPTQTSVARFLYNQNPFYLISCLLVIYGCQNLAISSGNLLDKSITMVGGIAAYTILMAVVCIAVVRLAKVWDDARSIFIVVVISLIAVTTGFDELCIGNRSMATAMASFAAAFVLTVTETVLWACRIRLGFWYRATYYAHFAILLGFPLALGRAVATRNDPLANWGSVLFSMAVAAGALLLIPALRRGPDSVKGNGTPWSWPLYPISAFVVMLVLAGIRSHAIWMSFGFYGTAGKFEPFLLLPLLAAVLILIVETGLGRGNQVLQRFSLVATPVLLLCAITGNGATWLPIGGDLRTYFGSSLTVALGFVFSVYLWMTIRGVQYAAFGLPATLLTTGFSATLPSTGAAYGLQSWMFPAAACVILLLMTFRMKNSDWLWAAVAGVATTTIAMAGDAYGRPNDGLIAASVFAVLAMLAIGIVFRTDLAVFLRYAAAGVIMFGTMAIVFRVLQSPGSMLLYAIAAIGVVALFYGMLIRRRGWLIIAALQISLFILITSYQGHRTGKLRRINWPIASGLMCLCVGVAITTGKTGVYHGIAKRIAQRNLDGKPSGFRSGL